ncbi:Uroporphyrinogen-III C-methyltransferase [bacterium HR36]|nr:Uroporphyrinogen-III C-methyltransferase [bacterium HR36]
MHRTAGRAPSSDTDARRCVRAFPMASPPTSGRVYLVGAGPGDPGLITLRGLECLQEAEVVLYDRLASERILDWAPRAEKHCVTEWGESHVERAPKVTQLLVELARQGKTVVRLKGGDPLVFGRGGEELLALAEAGIPFEVVPGVTAAIAAGAYTGIPLTHRGLSSAVALITGHQADDSPELDWASLARFPGTLAIYMGFDRLGQIAERLVAHGLPASTPAITVQWATTGQQRSVQTTLAHLAEAVRRAQLGPPAVTLIGPVVALRDALRWFEQRPLFGRRILLTRPRVLINSAIGVRSLSPADLARQLERLGACVETWPLIEIGPAPDAQAVQAALQQLQMGAFDWLVFTSANGVHATVQALEQIGADLRVLAGVKLAAIGPATAHALASYHLRADLVPEEYRSEALASALLPLVRGQRLLLLRADRGREILRQCLTAIAHVQQVAVYSQRELPDSPPAILERLRRGEYDFVALTSSNIARIFASRLDEVMRSQLGTKTRLVALSPVTGETLRQLGLPVAAEASEYTMSGLVQLLVTLSRAPSI